MAIKNPSDARLVSPAVGIIHSHSLGGDLVNSLIPEPHAFIQPIEQLAQILTRLPSLGCRKRVKFRLPSTGSQQVSLAEQANDLFEDDGRPGNSVGSLPAGLLPGGLDTIILERRAGRVAFA